jgi:hypothetical protein
VHSNREEGEKCTQRQPSLEEGEGGGAPADFDKDKRFPELGGSQTKAIELGVGGEEVACRPLRGQAAVGREFGGWHWRLLALTQRGENGGGGGG